MIRKRSIFRTKVGCNDLLPDSDVTSSHAIICIYTGQ